MDRRDTAVVAQGVSLAALMWPGRARWSLPRSAAVVAAAATLAGAALSASGAAAHGRLLTPHVVPPAQARLLTTGPYRFSRHPIYGGLLVAGAGVAVLRRRVEPLLAWVALAVTLHVKSGLEERVLRERFGRAYDDYAATTPRLLGPAGR